MFLFFAIFRLWEIRSTFCGRRKMVAKHEARACAVVNIAPYREERSSQVLSAPLPATTTHLSDSSSPDRSRSLALSLSLALSPTARSVCL